MYDVRDHKERCGTVRGIMHEVRLHGEGILQRACSGGLLAQDMLEYEMLPDSDSGSGATLSVPRRRRRMAPGQPQHRRQ